VLIGGAASIIAFRTKIAITPGDPLIESDLTSTPFTVRNEGDLTLRDLEITCRADTLIDTHANVIVGEERIMAKSRLPPDGEMTVGCFPSLTTPYFMDRDVVWTVAKISILVNYRVFGIPKTRTRIAHYLGAREGSGNLRWLVVQP
jgi:hypothetical protein